MSSQGFIKGMAAGIVLGACATMLVDPVSDRQRNKMRRRTEGMFKSLGNIMDTALDMFRWKMRCRKNIAMSLFVYIKLT